MMVISYSGGGVAVKELVENAYTAVQMLIFLQAGHFNNCLLYAPISIILIINNLANFDGLNVCLHFGQQNIY